MNKDTSASKNAQVNLVDQHLKERADLVKMGHQYSADFLYSLQEQAGEALYNWCKQHQVPKEVQHMVDVLMILAPLADRAEIGLNDFEACLLPETVSDLVKLTEQLNKL